MKPERTIAARGDVDAWNRDLCSRCAAACPFLDIDHLFFPAPVTACTHYHPEAIR